MPRRSRHRAALTALFAIIALLPQAGCSARKPTPPPLTRRPGWLHAADAAKPIGPRQLAFRWYGTAAFEVRTAKASVFFDPYLSREALSGLLFGPALPKPARWPGTFSRPDAIFIGHGHFDHYLDAPELARKTGAALYASADALQVARLEHTAADRLHAIAGGMQIPVGDLVVEVVTGHHSDMPTQALCGGMMGAKVKVPMWFLDYKNGPTFGFVIHWRGRSLVHIDSADFVDAALEGHKADVALFAMSGWPYTKNVFSRLYEAIGPDVLVPMHHDDFFRPFSDGVIEGPVAKLKEAYARIVQDMPQTAVLPIDFFQEYRIDPVETP